MQVKIEAINENGIGTCFHNGKKIFVPYTLPGEIVEIEVIKQNSKFTEARLSKIVSASPYRIDPVCKYFAKCGGCAMQHLAIDKYYDFKKDLINKKLNIANIELISIDRQSRRRATLKAKLNKQQLSLGYFKDSSHEIIDINRCEVLAQELNNLLPDLKKSIASFNSIIISADYLNVSITLADNGIDILFKSSHLLGPHDKKSLLELANKHNVARIHWQQDLIYQKTIPEISFAGNKIQLPFETFLQASNQSQEIMIDFVLKNAKGQKKILDLFSGIGTFSIPLSQNHKVHAFEGNASMVNILANSGYDLIAKQRDLYKNPIKSIELENFDLIVINPPRSGASPQIENIINMKIKKPVIMISCDLNNFATDLKLLLKSGLKIKDIIAIDQFVFTKHIEFMAYLA